MKKLLLYFFVSSFLFAIEKYKEEDVLSVWKINKEVPELITYKIKDSLGMLNSKKKQKDLWDIIIKFYPKEIINKIDTFVVFSDNNPNNEGGMFGLIEAANTENSSFILSLDISDSYYNGVLNLEELLSLLIHEFFHIISLDETQLSHEKTSGLKIFEGYTKDNSYINGFYRQFWTNPFSRKLDLLEKNPNLSYAEKKKMREELFEKNRDKFVDSYAMTNVVEDIAVSFEEFVRYNKKYLNDDLKDEKIQFFYSYPELIKLKEYFLEKRRDFFTKK